MVEVSTTHRRLNPVPSPRRIRPTDRRKGEDKGSGFRGGDPEDGSRRKEDGSPDAGSGEKRGEPVSDRATEEEKGRHIDVRI